MRFLYSFLPFFLIFLLIEAGFRLVLGLHELGNLSGGFVSLLASIGVGALMDVATFLYLLPLLALARVLMPDSWFAAERKTPTAVLYGAFVFLLLFNSIAEWLFWDELTSRFNFIAVDYLIYMDEVLGNIRESYPVGLLLVALAAVSAIAGWVLQRLLPPVPALNMRRRYRAAWLGVMLLAPLLSFALFSEGSGQFSQNRYNNEVAKNGIYSLFAAFKNNKLPYKDFYIAEDDDETLKHLHSLLDNGDGIYNARGIQRRIEADGEEIHPNIVLITVESLSADYMRAFGNTEGITPNLDKLARESLFFTNLYATGTRTVYGLSAITLSMPPIPGNAIARRPENGHLFSLGNTLNKKGYDSRFLYGGFGYFDNMNTFFGGNGYRIIDRTNLGEEEISFANVWGVCDEDIYNRALKENDASHDRGQPFFDMIMTTSNHQPFTYPDGHIDIPSGKGRLGGVKYTDYAIGKFMDAAKTRPWFDNTVFVIVADHTAGSSGKLDLTPEKHRIPMLFYAPKLIEPQLVDTMASQIDLAPTLLAQLHMDYDSKFYGHDILDPANEPRAFIANYQHVGLLKPDSLTILKPAQKADYYVRKGTEFEKRDRVEAAELAEAVAYFQNASRWRELSSDIGMGQIHADTE